MKISAINNSQPITFSRQNKKKESYHHNAITYDESKVRTVLAYMGTVAIVGATILAIRDAGNNIVKKAYNNVKKAAVSVVPDPVTIAIGKRRDAAAVAKYNAYCAKVKLGNLKKRIANGEFKDAPSHVLNSLKKQEAKLIKQCA